MAQPVHADWPVCPSPVGDNGHYESYYTLKIVVNGHGSTTPTAGTHTYIEGLRVSIKATPDSGWKFDGWTGDAADPALAETTVMMLSNKAVTANFSPIQHDLKIDVSGNGSINPAAEQQTYDLGTL